MPRRVQAPIDTQADADLLMTDVLPQPYRRIQNALLKIVDDAVDIAWRKQLAAEEASKKPSDQASHTLGPLTEFEGMETSSVQYMTGGVGCQLPRPFFAMADGEFRELGEDGAMAAVERPAAHPEGGEASVVAIGGAVVEGREVVAALTSASMVHVWKRAKPAPMNATAELGEAAASGTPQLQVRASLTVAAPPSPTDEGESPPFTGIQVSPDGRWLLLLRADTVVCYACPVPLEDPPDPAEGAPPELEVLTGELPEPQCVVSAPHATIEGLRAEAWFGQRAQPHELSAAGSSWCAELWVLWLNDTVMECRSLAPVLGGKAVVAEEGEEEAPPSQHAARFDTSSPITCSAVSAIGPAGEAVLATGLGDGTTVLWDMRDGAPQHILSRHIGPVARLGFSRALLVSIGADHKLHIYNSTNGQKVLEVEVPATGVFAMQCFGDLPLAMLVGARGPRLYDLSSGAVFAAFSTEEHLSILFEHPSVHIGSDFMLTMLASRPPPPPPPPEEGEPPPEEDSEPPADIVVPLAIEMVRVANAFHGRPLSSDPTAMAMGGATADWGATTSLVGGGTTMGMTKASVGSSKALDNTLGGTTMGRSQLPSRESSRMPRDSMFGTGAHTQQLAIEGGPSAFDGFPAEGADMAAKVTGFLRARHGERRLRDIRTKKRQVSILDHMREMEAR